MQLELNFQDRAKAFRTGRAKVTFTQLYLKGMALEWFEPDLLLRFLFSFLTSLILRLALVLN